MTASRRVTERQTQLNVSLLLAPRPDILVSTPLRLVHALQHQFVTLDRVEYIAIDEADRLFENGFEHQVRSSRCARVI